MRVMIVSDDPLARAGLASVLAAQPGIEVVDFGADAAVADVGSSHALDRAPDLPLVALVADEEQAAAALAAGARGVLLRSADGARIAAALRAVEAGLVVRDEGTFEPPRPSPPGPALPESLTAREREVLQLLSQGLANRAIGEALGIGERTVKFHVNAILGKLGARSRTEAVVMAVRLGLVAL